MGSWKLEAFKMSIYMMFPVGCFWLFNQPGVFEQWIMERRKVLYIPENPQARAELDALIEGMELKRQAQLEQQMKGAEK